MLRLQIVSLQSNKNEKKYTQLIADFDNGRLHTKTVPTDEYAACRCYYYLQG